MISIVAYALLSASDLSPAAVQLGLDLLGSASSSTGLMQLSAPALCERAGGVAWNTARVRLGELSGAGFLCYWSYALGADRYVVIAWLAWSAGKARAVPPAVPEEAFGGALMVGAGLGGDLGSITSNVRGDSLENPGQSARSAEIVPVVVVDPVLMDQGKKTTTTTNGRKRGRSSAPITSNVWGDPADDMPADSNDPAAVEAVCIRALLLDRDLGLGRPLARQCIGKAIEVGFSFRDLLGSVLEWRRQRDQKVLKAPGAALYHRIANGWGGSIIEDDRLSDFYLRHYGALVALESPQGAIMGIPADDRPAASPGPDVAALEASPDAAPAGDPVLASVAPAWAEVVAALGHDPLVGSSVVRADDDEVVVALRDPSWVSWVRDRFGGQAGRRLSVILGRPVSVAFAGGG